MRANSKMWDPEDKAGTNETLHNRNLEIAK